VEAAGSSETISFSLQGFDAALVQAGGWLEYADSKY
jgi:3-isopropylmalate/(R)-2-methylmalate dehydratase small subunit